MAICLHSIQDLFTLYIQTHAKKDSDSRSQVLSPFASGSSSEEWPVAGDDTVRQIGNKFQGKT